MTTEINQFEDRLASMQQGKLRPDAFMRELLDMELFAPLKVADAQSGQASLLVLQTEDDQRVLILFSSEARSKDFLADVDGFDSGVMTRFRHAMEQLGSGYGVSINPDAELGLDLDAGQLAPLWTTPTDNAHGQRLGKL